MHHIHGRAAYQQALMDAEVSFAQSYGLHSIDNTGLSRMVL